MAKLYVFGIGGTGSRVLRSLTMLLAAGADANGYTIVPIVIDPDHSNGNLTQTVTLMDEYVSIRNCLTFAGKNTNRFFSAKIEKILPNFTMPVNKTSNLKFREFIDLAGMQHKANQAMARMLFSDDNLNSDMKVGFEGNPNIGSVVLNQIKKSHDFKQFAQSFQPQDKIFIISSIFGGTGASGFPLLLKTMRRKDDSIPNNAAMNAAVIGALTVLPYFKLSQDDDSPIDSASFISKSKSALAYYDRTIASNNEINALYFIGDTAAKTYDNIKGGVQQTNQAHAIELLSATAILDFIHKDYSVTDHRYMELGVEDLTGALTLKSFYTGISKIIKYPLTQFALFALGMDKDKTFLSSKQLKKNTDLGLDEHFYKTTFVDKVVGFLESYTGWLNEMKSNAVSLDMFNMGSDNPFEFITGIKAKKFLSVVSYNWDTYRTALNKSKVTTTQAEDMFMEMYFNGLETLCREKFNL